jgi:hypothetical protein
MYQKLKLAVYLFTATAYLFLSDTAFARITNPVLPSDLGSGEDYGSGFAKIFANIWKSFFLLGSLFFILYFVWGAMRWMTAEGDKGKFEEGRNKIANGIIGLVILAASQMAIQFIGSVLDIPFLQSLSFEFPTYQP